MHASRSVAAALAAALALALLALALPAFAGAIDPTTSHSGTFLLTCEITTGNPAPTCPAAAPPYGVPGSYNYTTTFPAPQAVIGQINGNPVGFADSYGFMISGASADVVSATISLGGLYQINNFNARIYQLSGNGMVPLLDPASPVGTLVNGIVTGSGPATIVQINPVDLSAGSYVLEVSGQAVGALGGTYQGQVNLSPVPLPATLPLLLGGLGIIGRLARRRASARKAI